MYIYRSRGYSNLFALSRSDLESALTYHKEAAQILRLRADQIIRENAARQTQQKMETNNESNKETDKNNEGLRRRKSVVSGDIELMEETRRNSRCASRLSGRKLSYVSEDRVIN